MLNLQSLFYPRSIAVIGASTKTGTVGNDILKNIVTHQFNGPIYPINPKATTLYDLPCYPTIEAVPGPVDLAIIIVPAAIVPTVLEQAGKKAVKSAIVISAGFKETGPEGKKLEDQLTEIARNYTIALIGPNCLGMINPEINLHACFTTIMPAAGEIAFISQSGALCSSILDYAKGLGIGFSKFISIGNKALIDEVEIIEYLATDPKTKVIMMYEEQLSDAAQFIKTLRAITTRANGTPVISLKSGRTQVGAAASASHTGALGGDDAMIEAIFRKAGVTRAYTIEELFDYAVTFDHNPLPLGNRVAIVTNAGGPGVIATDSAFENGLRLAELSDTTKNILKEHLPAAASVNNPVDVLGDADANRYMHAIDAVMQDPAVDAGIVILTPQSMTQIEQTAHEIVRLRHTSNKPILSCFMGLESVGAGVRTLQEGDVATLAFPEDAARSLAALTHFALRTRMPYSEVVAPTGINKDRAEQHINRLLATPQHDLNEIQIRPILEAYGLSLLRSLPVHSPREAQMAASQFAGKQVVLKIMSPDIIHKSDVGGVMININPQEVESTYEDMIEIVSEKAPNAHLEGMIMSEMAPTGGFEFIVGGKRDDALGVATVMVGMGGVYVEVLKDVSFGMVPLTRYGAEKAISRTKAAKLLDGVRGQPPLDKEKLIDCLARVSCLLNDFPQIKELDINPLLVYPTGVLVLDARMRIGVS